MLGEKTRGLVEDFLHTLPCTDFAFAYGSAAFSQESSENSKKDGGDRMLDVIMLVDDPLDWHSEVRLSTQPTTSHHSMPLIQPARRALCAEHQIESSSLWPNSVTRRSHSAVDLTARCRVALQPFRDIWRPGACISVIKTLHVE